MLGSSILVKVVCEHFFTYRYARSNYQIEKYNFAYIFAFWRILTHSLSIQYWVFCNIRQIKGAFICLMLQKTQYWIEKKIDAKHYHIYWQAVFYTKKKNPPKKMNWKQTCNILIFISYHGFAKIQKPPHRIHAFIRATFHIVEKDQKV